MKRFRQIGLIYLFVINSNIAFSQVSNLSDSVAQGVWHDLYEHDYIVSKDYTDFFKEQLFSYDSLLQKVKDEQIIMLNEIHLNPQCRILWLKLIRDLKPYGFNKLFIETLSIDDNELAERKYPVLQSGYYTKEAVFGNLIREACNLDYKILPYDDMHNFKGTDSSEIQAFLEKYGQVAAISPPNVSFLGGEKSFVEEYSREYNAYQNIKENLNPGDKVIILCGFAHLKETQSKYGAFQFPLAWYIKTDLGINPLTIDQTSMISNTAIKNTLYKTVANDEYQFFQNTNADFSAQCFGRAIGTSTDIVAVSPIERIENGRTNWLDSRGYEKIEVSNDVKNMELPVKLVLYYEDESADQVPADVFIYKEKSYPLYLYHISDKKVKLRLIDLKE